MTCGYNIHLAEQEHALDKLNKLFASPVVCGRKKLLPFENGILISIQSTKALNTYLKETYNSFDYLLTSCLNQDILENKFSNIRGIGWDNKHPGPVDVRFRIPTLGRNPDVFLQKSPVEMTPEDEESQFSLLKLVQTLMHLMQLSQMMNLTISWLRSWEMMKISGTKIWEILTLKARQNLLNLPTKIAMIPRQDRTGTVTTKAWHTCMWLGLWPLSFI